jgi:hypothetical protein
MPTPESSEAFAKLVEARNRLTEITKRLNQASTGSGPEGFKADTLRYRELQLEWEAAFRHFEAATQHFNSSVKHLRDKFNAEHPAEESS